MHRPDRIASLKSRVSPVGVALGAAAAVRLAYFFSFARFVDVSGDEWFNFDRSADILNLIGIDKLDGRSFDASVAAIIDRGWFMPGMSMLLAPVRAFTDSLPAARMYIGTINLLLLATIVFMVTRRFGRRSGLITAVMGGIFPAMVVFSFTFWGEMLAGQLVAVSFLLLLDLSDQPEWGKGSLRRWALVATLLLVVVYLRPSHLILVPVALLLVVLSNLHNRRKVTEAIRDSVVPALVIIAVLVVGIAPWSYVLSSHKDGFFLTTTTIELNLIVSFGLPEDVKGVPDSGNPYASWDDWVEAESTRLGEPYGEVLTAERKRVLSEVDFAHYRDTVQEQLIEFYLLENQFFNRFARSAMDNPAALDITTTRGLHSAIRDINTVMWRIMLVFGLVLLVVPLSAKKQNWWPALIFKATFIGLSIQPFVSVAHPRYFSGLASLLVVTVGAVATDRFRALEFAWADRLEDLTAGEKGVLLAQAGAVVMVVGAVFLVAPR